MVPFVGRDLRSEVSDLSQKVRLRVPTAHDLPSDQLRTATEEHDRARLSVGARPDAGLDAPASRFTRPQRGGVDRQARCAAGAQAGGFLLTERIALGSAGEHPHRHLWFCRDLGVVDLDRPQGAPHGCDVLGLLDLLVSKELGPRPVGRVRKVLNRTVPVAVPSCRRLIGALPQKRPAGIGVAKEDHVAVAKMSE